ncbi:MAG: manganese catalase family protein [Bacilli bacterium]|nr:manganese catalase family protein [Bacilli bacterium]
MFKYEKMLEYPINVKKKDLRMAKLLTSQFGGPDGELGAALRYLSQRFSMPDERGKALLTDIGTEELGHVEMICTMVNQLLKNSSLEELKKEGLDSWYTQHNKGVYPTDSNGIPFTAAYIASTGNPIVDLQEDLAAEEKARATYENLMDLTNDESLLAPLSFLRQREVVHYNRFKELLDYYKEKGY